MIFIFTYEKLNKSVKRIINRQEITRKDIICLLSDYVMQDKVSEEEAKVAAEFAGVLASFEGRDNYD